MELIEKIAEELDELHAQEDFDPECVDNSLFKGMQILDKYEGSIEAYAARDELWIGLYKDEEMEKMTEEDIREMYRLGFDWDEGSFHTFV